MENKPAKSTNKKKTTVAVIMAAACLVCIVGLFFVNSGDLTFNFDFGAAETTKQQVVYDGKGEHRISLYDPDWESDIFKNPAYLDKNRYITYVDGGMALTLVDGDYSAYGEPVELLAGYVDALMHGDSDAANAYFADSYFDTHERLGKITMQKLYNIQIEYITQSDIPDGNSGTLTRYYYKLTYMIMENDGTFRNDVTSDAEKPQFYEIVDDGYELKITGVSNYYIVEQ